MPLGLCAGLIVAIALICCDRSFAQATAPVRPPTTGVDVQVLTMGPGPAIWEKFGHNAVAVIDHASGSNLAYNYGIFDFNQHDFIIRFLRGEMRYWMESADTVSMIGPYFAQGRAVWGQQLALSQSQAGALQTYLENNALPQNKFYDYNYYADNCSTRARDAIDHAVGGELKRQLSAIMTGRTYRRHTLIAMESDPFISFGIDFSLSAYADRELSAWDESFMPVEFMRHLGRVTIDDGSGRRIALVARDRQLQKAIDALRISDNPPRRWPALLAIGVAGGLVMLLCGVAARSRLGRIFAATCWAAWGFIAGIGGWYLLIMWLFTKHVAAYANENLLQTSPLAMALVVVAPLAAFGRARKMAAGIAVACCAMSLLGLVCKLLPLFRQDNWNILALTVPINLSLCAAILLLRRQPAEPTKVAVEAEVPRAARR